MKLKLLFNGFKFGLLLQFAVGPICLFVFSTANNLNFYSAELAVLSVALIDFCFILMAIHGISSFLKNKRKQFFIKLFGSFILLFFGINMIFNSFNISIIPNFKLLSGNNINNSFIKGLILTGSNPLTIVFWSGIFSAKLDNMTKKDMYFFGIGAVLATIFFLTLISVIGSFTSAFLSNKTINIMNIFVGIFFIIYSFFIIIKK